MFWHCLYGSYIICWVPKNTISWKYLLLHIHTKFNLNSSQLSAYHFHTRYLLWYETQTKNLKFQNLKDKVNYKFMFFTKLLINTYTRDHLSFSSSLLYSWFKISFLTANLSGPKTLRLTDSSFILALIMVIKQPFAKHGCSSNANKCFLVKFFLPTTQC